MSFYIVHCRKSNAFDVLNVPSTVQKETSSVYDKNSQFPCPAHANCFVTSSMSLVQRQQRCDGRTYRAETVEQRVDGGWRNEDAVVQQLERPVCTAQTDNPVPGHTLHRTPATHYTVHRHPKLVCDSICHIEPMQLRMKQVCQAMVVLLRAAHNLCCSVHDALQLVGNRLWCSGQQQKAIVDAGRNEGINQYGCRFVDMSPSLSSTSSRAIPTILPRPSILPQGSDIREYQEHSWKKHEEPEDMNLHYLYTRLILNSMRPLVNCWSPLTHTSHCVTTSWPTAATQTRARVSRAIQPKVFLQKMLFLSQHPCFLALNWLRLC